MGMTARYKSLPLKIVSIVVLGLGLLVGIGGGAMASKDGQTLPSSRSEAVSDSLNAQALDTLHVLVMLPFGLGVDTLPGGSLPRKTIRLREIALESLHGLECAALELAGEGLHVELIVSDEIPDSTGRILLLDEYRFYRKNNTTNLTVVESKHTLLLYINSEVEVL